MSQRSRREPGAALAAVSLAALLAGCAGDGVGLDANGAPVGAGNAAPPPPALSADFQSIQDNVFTPICVRCHSGPAAPEGLQLDAAHSYALLVGVPSAEVSGVLRVDPGAPDKSYLVLKLEGAPGIVGAQMPFGETPLPQATIDVIRQWVSDGAQGARGRSQQQGIPGRRGVAARAVGGERARGADRGGVQSRSRCLARQYTTLSSRPPHRRRRAAGRRFGRTAARQGQSARGAGDAGGALGAGRYRLTLRGTGGAALADRDATCSGATTPSNSPWSGAP